MQSCRGYGHPIKCSSQAGHPDPLIAPQSTHSGMFSPRYLPPKFMDHMPKAPLDSFAKSWPNHRISYIIFEFVESAEPMGYDPRNPSPRFKFAGGADGLHHWMGHAILLAGLAGHSPQECVILECLQLRRECPAFFASRRAAFKTASMPHDGICPRRQSPSQNGRRHPEHCSGGPTVPQAAQIISAIAVPIRPLVGG